MSDYGEKIRHFCAYQERCHAEVRKKLLALSVYGAELEETISRLIEEDFLNEERFARSYCRGKFELKQWGKIKIIQSLKAKQVSAYCIQKGLSEIPETKYRHTFEQLFDKKKRELAGETNHWILKRKLKDFLLRRGFEPDLIYDRLQNMETK